MEKLININKSYSTIYKIGRVTNDYDNDNLLVEIIKKEVDSDTKDVLRQQTFDILMFREDNYINAINQIKSLGEEKFLEGVLNNRLKDIV